MAELLDLPDVRRDVYALPIADRWLLYSPWTWTGALVNRAAAAAMARRWRDPAAPLPKSLRPLWARLSSAPGRKAWRRTSRDVPGLCPGLSRRRPARELPHPPEVA